MSKNRLEGVIPECLGNFSSILAVLNLKENLLHGVLPTNFAEDNSLLYLNLNGNKLVGKLPKSLLNCGKLQFLDLGNNEIQDTFPYWVGSLPELRVLVLSGNRFHGKVSPSSSTKLPFPKLQIFDLSANMFTGPLPDEYFKNFVAMANVKINVTDKGRWFSTYREPVSLIVKGSKNEVQRILITFTIIDLSRNKFNGRIPFSIGNLNSLVYLNLSSNNFTGGIPTSLGDSAAVEALDLSFNQLVGEIPWQLTDLTFLAFLNLSYNHLVGPIPKPVGQFITFETSSYLGNPGLCGFPLTNKCGGDDKRSPLLPDEDDDIFHGFTWKLVVAIGYGCGFVLGVVLGCLMFIYRRPMWLLNLFFGVENKIKHN
ncbi:hypothetical protein ACS0TY_000742 [Phlomoides rotata]